ncbi:heparan-alpha-glucosaminide N-acetyltransferase domain-containing protein [Geodermatophilus sp. SYSU D00703]
MSAHPCASPPVTPPPVTAAGSGGRVTGVDVARGLALFGMMAAHEFDLVGDDGRLTATGAVASGRSAVTFALLAGVSLAFLSGGRDVVRGQARTAASAGLAVRAVLVLVIGLLLGALDTVEVILPAYALLFLLAIPLLGLRPRVLLAIAAGLVAAVPVLLVATAADGLEYGSRPDPTLGTLLADPAGVLLQLLVTGAYPVLLYLAYTCVGLAVGRLDLRSRRVAWTLLGVGVPLVVTAQAVSAVLLHPLGGLRRLTEADYWSGDLVAEPDQGSSWWYLALDSPHAHTQLDALNAVGSALTVLGAALLLTRIHAVDRLLRPVAAAGSMTLTLYSAHVLLLWTEVPDDEVAQYLLMVVGSMLFAVLWRRTHVHGPLEGVVAAPSRRTRRAVLSRSSPRRR